VAVTVAVVRYSALELARVGVASTFLAERLALGDTAPLYIAKNPDFRLPGACMRACARVCARRWRRRSR
jgi:sulfite reductase (NADPH) flavoprotein alpha-component